jgi:hypothetical protein
LTTWFANRIASGALCASANRRGKSSGGNPIRFASCNATAPDLNPRGTGEGLVSATATIVRPPGFGCPS